MKDPLMEIKGGMTLRDYFAGQALIGFCANTDLVKIMEQGNSGNSIENVAEFTYKYADAMLKQREEQ